MKTALADDFDTPKAMSAIMNLVHVCNIELSRKPTPVRQQQVMSAAGVKPSLDHWRIRSCVLVFRMIAGSKTYLLKCHACDSNCFSIDVYTSDPCMEAARILSPIGVSLYSLGARTPTALS